MKKITIIGSGFAALTAAKKMRKLDSQAEITLIAPQAKLIYLASLIWIPTKLRTREDLTVDLQKFIKKNKLNFVQGKVTGIENNGRTVITEDNKIDNDGLIIASGGRFIKKLPGIEHAIALCEGLDAAEKIKATLDTMEEGTLGFGFGANPNEPSAMRGGPMFELLFGIDTYLRRQKRRDKFKLVFFSPAPQPGKRLGEKAVTGILKEMQNRNIETHLGHKIKAFEADKIITEGGEIKTNAIFFMPGMTGPAWLENTNLPKSAGGLIQADEYTKVAGFEKVYVAGDSGSYPGPDWMPKQAHMADLQAEAAAENLWLELHEKPADKKFKTELICIVDMLDKGVLVFRDEKRTIVWPCKLLHLAKQFFEWWYLKEYK